jgi:hypothetical protein
MKIRRKSMKCLMMILLIFLGVISGCSQAIELARPPFKPRPTLESLKTDKNDETGERGYWMNRKDAEELADYFIHNDHMIETWH